MCLVARTINFYNNFILGKKSEHNESLGYLVNRAGKMMSNMAQTKMREKGLVLAHEHMVLLFMLWRQDGLNQKELVGSIIKDKSTITRGLNALEKQDIIVRITDEKDKRNKRIFLTNKGKSLKKEIKPLVYEVNDTAAENISQKDLLTCKKVLNQIYENLINI